MQFKIGNKFKDVEIKNCTYHLFGDMINIKNLDPDEKLYKNITIYYIKLVL